MSLINKASLVITPNAVKESKLYSVIPNTSLGDMSVVRATTATRVNSEGFIEETPYNLSGYSEMFSNAYWVKNNCTISTDAIISPNGTLTADKIVEDTSLGNHRIFSASTVIVNNIYTQSIYAKSAGRIYFSIRPDGNANAAVFNLQNGTIISVSSGVTATITEVGNGWFRCSASKIASQSSWTTLFNLQLDANIINYTGDGVSGVYFWGAQLVQGSVPKDYFYTTNRLNVPRLNYDVAGSCPSILLEPQRTNLALRSEEFENLTTWTNVIGGTGVNPIRVANSAISPVGTQNADTITFNRGAGNTITDQSAINQQINIASVGNTVLSIWIKATNPSDIGKEVFIRCGNTSNLQPEILAANWRRVFLVTNIAATGSNTFQIGNRGTFTTGNSVSVDLWGAQVEAGAYPTSYIPTVASTVTRNLDDITKTGVSTDILNPSEGTFYVEIAALANDLTSRIIELSDGTDYNRVTIQFSSASNVIRLDTYGQTGVGTSTNFRSTVTVSNTTTFNKCLIKWGAGGLFAYVNGIKYTLTYATGTIGGSGIPNVLNRINFKLYYGAGYFYGKCKGMQIYKTALSDTECAALTTL